MARQRTTPQNSPAGAPAKAKGRTAAKGKEEKDASEMRHSLRARRPFVVSYANLTHSPASGYHYYRSAIVDLSPTGIGLIVEDRIERGDLLQVVVSLPVRPFVVTGLAETVWVRLIAAGARWRAGLRFIQMPTKLSERIIEELL